MHRKQLHERVLERQSQLAATLELLTETAPDSSRVAAISQAIATLDEHLQRPWDEIGELEAGQITRWFDATQSLCEPGAAERAEPILLRLQTRWRLETVGLPEPLEGSAG